MKKLLFLLLFPSCILLPGQKANYEYCGKVGTLDVYCKEYSLLSCKDVMEITQDAHNLLLQKAGPLNLPWRLEYTWEYTSIEKPLGTTYFTESLIKVQVNSPYSVLHEMFHAYLFETNTGGSNHHKKICGNEEWHKAEYNFGVRPYCHLRGIE